MMSDDEEVKQTIRANGEVVFGALKSLKGSATITHVVDYLASTNDLRPDKIKQPVQDILTTGYNLGFLSKRGARYMIDPKHVTQRRSRSTRSRSRSRQFRSRSRKR